MIKYILSVFLILGLVGCGTFTTKEVEVVKPKTVLVTPPVELMTKCAVEPPPGTKEYIAADWSHKEEMLINHSSNQMKNLFKCNAMIKSLNEWVDEQTRLYMPDKK